MRFLRNLFSGKTKDTSKQFIRYFISGSIGAGCDIAIFSFLTFFLDINYLISNAAGFFFSLVLTYVLNVIWVFSGSKIKDRKREFLIFMILCLVSLAISESLLFTFVSFLGMNELISKMIVTLAVVAYNFTVRKIFLFN